VILVLISDFTIEISFGLRSKKSSFKNATKLKSNFKCDKKIQLCFSKFGDFFLKEKGIFFLHFLHFGTRKMQVVTLLIIHKRN
jgi:hypothetical protein